MERNNHIMISYSWYYKKELVDKFYEYAKQNTSYTFWKDDQNGMMVQLTVFF